MSGENTEPMNANAERAPRSNDEPAMSTRAKVVAGVAVAVLALAGVAIFMRVGAPKIRPRQLPPSSHYSAPCDWCHVRSADAPKIEVK